MRDTRPRRSVLYMPASNVRALEKARDLPVDGVILDLEDSVGPAFKTQARAQAVAAVTTGGFGRREVIIRVNGLDGPWGADDLAAVATCGADAILLPKVEHAASLNTAAERLAALGAPERTTLWVMLETPRGFLEAAAIAAATPRLACLVMGTSDLAKDLHARHTPLRLPFLTALSFAMLAARANDRAILDGVHLDLDDDAGLAETCRQGVELGFDGKTLIHPRQIAAANTAFAPSPKEIAWSKKIIAAFDATHAEGSAVVVVDGQLVEALHVANARRLLALAAAIAKP